MNANIQSIRPAPRYDSGSFASAARSIAGVVFGAGLLLSVDPAAAQTAKSLYRWTDANGQVHYGDSVPASAAQTERDQLSSGRSGVSVKKILAAPKSEEQLAREQAEAAAKQKDDARDRALLATYSSAAEIEAARDATEQDMQRQIAETQRALGQATDTLDRLHKRRASAGEDSDPAQKQKLDDQIKNFERLVPADEKILQELNEKRERLADSFGSDLARYIKLKGGAAPAPR